MIVFAKLIKDQFNQNYQRLGIHGSTINPQQNCIRKGVQKQVEEGEANIEKRNKQ